MNLNLKNLLTKECLINSLSIIIFFFSITHFYDPNFLEFHNAELFSNFLNGSVKVFQNLIFGFLFINFFTKFKYYYLGFISPIAFLEQETNFFVNQINPLLLNNGIYGIFSNHPEYISPEYPRILFFTLILFIGCILIFFKKWRNIQRIFVFIASLSCFLTAILFHTIIIYEIDSFKKSEKKTMFNILNHSVDVATFSKSCAINEYKCFYFPNDPEEVFKNDEIPAFIIRDIQFLKEDFFKNKNFFFYSVAHDPTSINRVLGQKTYSLIKSQYISGFIINDGTLKDVFIVNQLVFGILAWTSHFVWFFGTLFLIWFHDYKFKKRIKNQIEIKS